MLDPPLELLQVLQIRGFAFHGWGLGTPGCPNRFRGMPTMLVRAKFELLGLHMVRSVCVPGGSRRALGAPGLAKPSSFKRPACSDPSSNRPRLTSPSFLPTVSCCCPTWSVCSKAAGSMPGWGPERVEEQRARQLRDQYGLQLGDDLAYAFVSPSRTQCALVANPLQSNGWKQGPTPDQSLLHDAANTGSSFDRRPLSRRAKG